MLVIMLVLYVKCIRRKINILSMSIMQLDFLRCIARDKVKVMD